MTVEMLPLRHAAQVLVSNVDKKTADGEPPVRLVNYTDVYYRAVITPDLPLMEATATPEQVHKFRVLPGDSIITKDSETPEDIGVPSYIEAAAPDMVCGYHLALLRPGSRLDPKFLFWALTSNQTREQFVVASNGMTRYGLTYDAIESATIPVPDVEEQRRIADFLDDQTTRIDQIINARQRQIDSLEEHARSFAEHAAWGGLSRQSRSASGVDPAPPVPDHWRRIRNRYVFRERVQLSDEGAEELLSVSHLTGITPRTEKNVTMFMADSLAGYKQVQPGDLVINTLWAWMGALGVSGLEGIVSPAYGVYAPVIPDLLPAFANSLYRSSAYVCEMTRHSKGVWSSRLRLYPESFLALWTVLPPLDEQKAIARAVHDVESASAGRAALLRNSVDLLHEFRRSLISAAVSGEFDVAAASGRGVPA